jgi:hypothetical protein
MTRHLGLIFAALALAASFAALPATIRAEAGEQVVFGFDGTPGRDGVPRPWRLNKWAPVVGLGGWEATAKVATEGGAKALHLKSVKSGFLVGTDRQVDVSTYRVASWGWKAVTLPTGGSFKQRSTNDQALQLLFGFEGGTVVGYIWDGSGQVGASGSGLAWREDVRVIVVEAGPSKLGQWVKERRDLAEDYRRLFKSDPPMLKGVAIQSNSQHTGTTGEGFVGPITLSKS